MVLIVMALAFWMAGAQWPRFGLIERFYFDVLTRCILFKTQPSFPG